MSTGDEAARKKKFYTAQRETAQARQDKMRSSGSAYDPQADEIGFKLTQAKHMEEARKRRARKKGRPK
jgi:hypothetical protein